jgi:soluble lytic murein transglycosylase-like protein
MAIRPRLGNVLDSWLLWCSRPKRAWLWAVLLCLLAATGCGGIRNTTAPLERVQDNSPAAEQDDSLAGDANDQRFEELYAKSGIKDRDRTIEEELRKWEHQAKIDVPIQMNQQVKAYIVYFATKRKAVIKNQLARSTRYLPMIQGVFREYGLPEDLAYLAMVESGFNPQARSPAGACGLWQFIKGTGLRYGLVINGTVDERLDPDKSTRAAARYLLDLYKQFGSWYLAAASYNCGERRVQKELTKSNYKNFWELSANKCIPGETRNYVPQMIAATIIARNPQKFGFTNVPYQSPGSPHTAPSIAVAEVASPHEDPAPPQHTQTASLVSRPSVPTPPPMAVKVKHTTKAYARDHNKAPGVRTCAVGRNGSDRKAAQTRPQPYVASLFGAPKASASKSKSHPNKQKSSSHQKSLASGKTKKGSLPPTHLAKKSQTKPTHLASKKAGNKGKVTRSKSKSKALLVSQAR